jgi:hypothetical protein
MTRQRTLEGQISISRPSGGDRDGEYVSITLKDNKSRIEFLRVEVDLARFAEALTGLSCVPVTLNVRSLDLVGRTRITEPAKFTLTRAYLKEKGVESYDKKALRELMVQDPDGIFQRAGWTLDTYLGSQNSITYEGQNMTIHSHYTTYEETS